MAILSILYSMFSVLVKPFKMFIDLVKTDPKKALIIVAVLAALFTVYKINSHINDLNDKVTKSVKAEQAAITAKKEIQDALDVAVQVNKDNQAIIVKMAEDKIVDAKRIDDLSKSISVKTKERNTLISTIQKSDKADDGPLAKVLVDTMRTLQHRGAK